MFSNVGNSEKLCAEVFGGDFDCNGKFTASDTTIARKILLDYPTSSAAKLRTDLHGNGSELDITGLVRLNNIVSGKIDAPEKPEKDIADTAEDPFTADYESENEAVEIESGAITNYSAVITDDVSEEAISKGDAFAKEITNGFVADFEKSGIDLMTHVSTFIYTEDTIYMTYYANTQTAAENPSNQIARFAYCPIDEPDKQIIYDIQSAGEEYCGYAVNGVYDTILAQKGERTLYILWTANIDGKYYRLYCTFDTVTKKLGEIKVNKFKVGDVVNDFSTTGITSALKANNIGCKEMYVDIGIMQKFTTRIEGGKTYYYTGAYCGGFNCIVKTEDFITWEYVAQPDFVNQSQWENAVYVIGDKCYYFVRQIGSIYGFLTTYDLVTGVWETPVLVEDCQSRSDFIMYDGELYLFHAPVDRQHIGIIKIDRTNIADSTVVLQAKMDTSCFYPYVQYGNDGELRMAYTVNRQHIRLAKFDLSNYI